VADLPQNGRDREMQGAMQAKAEANLGVIKYRSSRANVVVVGYFSNVPNQIIDLGRIDCGLIFCLWARTQKNHEINRFRT